MFEFLDEDMPIFNYQIFKFKQISHFFGKKYFSLKFRLFGIFFVLDWDIFPRAGLKILVNIESSLFFIPKKCSSNNSANFRLSDREI